MRGWASFRAVLVWLIAVRLALMAAMPVFEPSEARYAAISANMARSGDFVVPHFTHNLEYQSFDGKPPLVFQAGGLFCRALGTDAPWKLQLGVRLFPFFSAALLLAIVFFTVRRLADAETARRAVMVCATVTAFYAAAGISMTDMTLTCCVAGALLIYRRFIEKPGLPAAAGVAALLGAGMITKGPVSLVLFALPVLADAAVNRRWRGIFDRRWLYALPVFLAVAVPWFVLIERRNPGSVLYFFYNENFLRFVSHDYGDRYGAGREAFRGVSVVWAFVATLPWALVPLWEVLCAFRERRLTRLSVCGALRDFWALAVLSIVGFWCLTSRVLLYYLFPVIPLFAVWLAGRPVMRRLDRLAPYAALLTALVVTGALVGGAMFSEKMQGAKTPFSLCENHYAYEFYHGRKTDAELAKCRKAIDEWRAQRRKACEPKHGGGEK